MEEKFFIGIISHKKSTRRDEQRKVWEKYSNPNLIYYYFVGDPNIDQDYVVDESNKTVTLRVPDNYESLSKKTRGIIKFYLENFSDSTKGMLKTDDDIEIDPDMIYNMLSENSENNYYGVVVNVVNYYESTYHWGKCESEYWNRTRAIVPQAKYCAGGGYYIRKEIAQLMPERFDIYDAIIFEDVASGILLNRLDVYPEDINIKTQGLVW
jgi:hypothetical protein